MNAIYSEIVKVLPPDQQAEALASFQYLHEISGAGDDQFLANWFRASQVLALYQTQISNSITHGVKSIDGINGSLDLFLNDLSDYLSSDSLHGAINEAFQVRYQEMFTQIEALDKKIRQTYIDTSSMAFNIDKQISAYQLLLNELIEQVKENRKSMKIAILQSSIASGIVFSLLFHFFK